MSSRQSDSGLEMAFGDPCGCEGAAALRAEVERLREHIDRAVAHMDKNEQHAAYAEMRFAQAPPTR